MTPTAIRPRRSVLYMPGSNARALEKARTLDVDGVILDLEDAVAPDAKATAREQVGAAIRAGGFGSREVVGRINGLDTPWGEDDLKAMAAAGPDAILVPKVSSPAQVVRVASIMSQAGAPEHTRLWAMVETPLAILNIQAIAAAAADPANRLTCFVMGTNDLAKETRARFTGDRLPFLHWLSVSVTAARAYGLDILDGVFNGITDESGLQAECEQGRDLGFDGKTLIHPSQIAAANAIFAPTAPEVEWSRAIIAAFDLPENRDKGALQLNGKMVERLHAEMGKRVVAIADAIAARG
ncbi:citrate lyase subunit beta [Alsobacter metallidurans]|uniref:Citrate lyase subunit beta n=1 Tax=Alsobacter metallidurans TaxID=340221 RepID=A0A917IBX0_9HYPH|nr:CoA ester lyase [Alsobacter metallidurans]GGH33320.1 citrate lyase subunit beta [Alsobacter metallidurans]